MTLVVSQAVRRQGTFSHEKSYSIFRKMKKKAYLFVSGCLLTLMFLWAFLGFQT